MTAHHAVPDGFSSFLTSVSKSSSDAQLSTFSCGFPGSPNPFFPCGFPGSPTPFFPCRFPDSPTPFFPCGFPGSPTPFFPCGFPGSPTPFFPYGFPGSPTPFFPCRFPDISILFFPYGFPGSPTPFFSCGFPGSRTPFFPCGFQGGAWRVARRRDDAGHVSTTRTRRHGKVGQRIVRHWQPFNFYFFTLVAAVTQKWFDSVLTRRSCRSWTLLFVGSLMSQLHTQCISGTALLRQLYVLSH